MFMTTGPVFGATVHTRLGGWLVPAGYDGGSLCLGVSTGHWLAGDAAGYRMRVDGDRRDVLRVRELAGRAKAAGEAGRA